MAKPHVYNGVVVWKGDGKRAISIVADGRTVSDGKEAQRAAIARDAPKKEGDDRATRATILSDFEAL